MAVRFSPKILGLNAGIFGTVFEQSETEFSGLFSNSPGLNFGIVFGHCRTEILGLFGQSRD